MISRKIENELLRFSKSTNNHALLVDGARQVGKTSIIEDFCRRHYNSFVKIDFIRTLGACDIFYLPIYLLSFLRPMPLPEKMIFDI